MYYVYIHQNKITLKVYVGYTNNPKRRWRNTKRSAFNPKAKDHALPIMRAIRKYGWEGFTHQVMEEFDNQQDALDAEVFWVEFFRSCIRKYGNEYGYNLLEGGNAPVINKGFKRGPMSNDTKQKLRDCRLGKTLTEETKQKISDANKGENNAFFGKKHSEESKGKMSKAHEGNTNRLGISCREDTKMKISAALTGNPSPRKGVTLSNEIKNKISKSKTGKNLKLSTEQIIEIQNSPLGSRKLAKLYNVDRKTIQHYKRMKSI